MNGLHPLLPSGAFQVEDERQALARYHGFGDDLLPRVFEREPHLRTAVQYFRPMDEFNDLWAIVTTPCGDFGIQLDPDCRCICLFREGHQEEFFEVNPDPVGMALERIRAFFLVPSN